MMMMRMMMMMICEYSVSFLLYMILISIVWTLLSSHMLCSSLSQDTLDNSMLSERFSFHTVDAIPILCSLLMQLFDIHNSNLRISSENLLQQSRTPIDARTCLHILPPHDHPKDNKTFF